MTNNKYILFDDLVYGKMNNDKKAQVSLPVGSQVTQLCLIAALSSAIKINV
jgi:hypothetical protein